MRFSPWQLLHKITVIKSVFFCLRPKPGIIWNARWRQQVRRCVGCVNHFRAPWLAKLSLTRHLPRWIKLALTSLSAKKEKQLFTVKNSETQNEIKMTKKTEKIDMSLGTSRPAENQPVCEPRLGPIRVVDQPDAIDNGSQNRLYTV